MTTNSGVSSKEDMIKIRSLFQVLDNKLVLFKTLEHKLSIANS